MPSLAQNSRDLAALLPGLNAKTRKKPKTLAPPSIRERLINLLPVLSVGAIGAGAGLGWVRDQAISPALRGDMQDFMKKIQLDEALGSKLAVPEAQRGLQGLVDYAVQGSNILKNRTVFGTDPVSLLRFVRSGPWIPKDSPVKWNDSSGQHYRSFQEGPLTGVVKLLGEVSGGWALPRSQSRTGALPQSARDAIRDSANKLVRQETGVQNYFDASDGAGKAFDLAAASKPDQLSFQQQKELARKIPAALQAGLPAEQFKVLADGAAKVEDDVYTGYKTLIGPILKADTTAGQLATGLAAAGVAGLGGYGVYRGLKYWHNRIRERAAEKAKREAKTRS